MSKIIGVFPMFNTGGICVHAIDDAEDKVLASVNGENPEWCEMAEQPQEDGDEMESGFLLGSFFVPCVQRSWTTLAGESPVTVIASEPCS